MESGPGKVYFDMCSFLLSSAERRHLMIPQSSMASQIAEEGKSWYIFCRQV